MEIFNGSDEYSAENNDAIKYINELNEQLTNIINRKELASLKVEDLVEQINARETKKENIKRSLTESHNVAAEIINIASLKAQEVIAEAEAVVAPWQAQLVLIEQEIAAIQEEMNSRLAKDKDETLDNRGYVVVDVAPPEINELDSGQQYIDDTVGNELFFPQENQIDSNLSNLENADSDKQPAHSLKLGIRRKKPQKKQADDALYNIQLVAFVNARHFVTFGGKDGPVHAHSWQAQIEVQVPPEKGEVMGFAKISTAITDALSPYENTILNYVHPFNIIQPTTESIAMYFFNCLEDALMSLGLSLAMLTLWETPTRGIQVTNRNVSFDGLIKLAEKEQTALEMAALSEQAAAADLAFRERIKDMFEKVRVKRPLRLSTEWAEGPLRPHSSIGNYAVAAGIIIVAAFVMYHNILFVSADQRYPWGSDTWGHLFKADYLYQQILQGNYYPQFTEYWYNGVQPFRYWAPLPYYLLALLEAITGDVFTAGNLYIFILTLFGALSCLLLARYMGLWPAVMTGLLWLVWQDNVRIAFSEGNFPWVMAIAFLPSLFIAFLQVMSKKKTASAIITTIVLIHIVILSHAMIGAIYLVCLCGFAFFLWIFNGCRIQDGITGIGVLLVGIGTSAWWLLPSLTGGIVGLDTDAAKAAIQMIPASISFDPFYRFSYRDNFYWGISLLVAIFLSLVTWRSKPSWAKSLIVLGIILIIITFPFLRPIYTSLPLSHLLRPLRFSSFAGFALIVAAFAFRLPQQRSGWLKSRYTAGIITIALFAVLMVDSLFSVNLLVHTGTNSSKIQMTAVDLKDNSGWRVATIDMSELGSAPSYTFSETAALEQVFGWAWQGAITSRNIMLLNTGLEMQYYQFLFRSCIDLGATELVVKDDVIKQPEEFWEAAELAGYKYQQTYNGLSLWHSLDQPYLVVKKPECLVIGRYAGTIALQFPEVEMGFSNEIDRYSAEYLKQYPKIILSGAKWTSKINAEKLIADYLDSGGNLIVELSGMPENVLAKQPEFLGVYGEPVTLRGQFVIKGEDKTYELAPVPVDINMWKAYVPMGLDHVAMEFEYYGNQAPVWGYKVVNGKKVWFLGSNLAYHSFMTEDPVALQILKETLGLDNTYHATRTIPLHNYMASENGYTMEYQAEKDLEAILPISAVDGMIVKVDGNVITSGKYENLLKLDLPGGYHQINISIINTPIYWWGLVISLLSLIALAAITLYMTKYMPSEKISQGEVVL
ncbi:MAG: 6-pyruvoyl-tetrahydropterin synthase-related protein [Syntrophomonas sp.]|nr:6-pyruvoyl-tetrahydropterin synthase-related protein [Syntrophomonas sp.]